MIVKDTVALDSEWHDVNIGPIRFVGHDPESASTVTFYWDTAYDPVARRLRAYATDESVDAESEYIGTDLNPETGVAHHLYQRSDVGVNRQASSVQHPEESGGTKKKAGAKS